MSIDACLLHILAVIILSVLDGLWGIADVISFATWRRNSGSMAYQFYGLHFALYGFGQGDHYVWVSLTALSCIVKLWSHNDRVVLVWYFLKVEMGNVSSSSATTLLWLFHGKSNASSMMRPYVCRTSCLGPVVFPQLQSVEYLWATIGWEDQFFRDKRCRCQIKKTLLYLDGGCVSVSKRHWEVCSLWQSVCCGGGEEPSISGGFGTGSGRAQKGDIEAHQPIK